MTADHWIATALALAAAWRLILWRWHVRKNCDWLAKRFGPSPDNLIAARWHSLLWAAGLAGAAVVVLYA